MSGCRRGPPVRPDWCATLSRAEQLLESSRALAEVIALATADERAGNAADPVGGAEPFAGASSWPRKCLPSARHERPGAARRPGVLHATEARRVETALTDRAADEGSRPRSAMPFDAATETRAQVLLEYLAHCVPRKRIDDFELLGALLDGETLEAAVLTDVVELDVVIPPAAPRRPRPALLCVRLVVRIRRRPRRRDDGRAFPRPRRRKCSLRCG